MNGTCECRGNNLNIHTIYQQDGVPRARCRSLSLYVYKNREKENAIVFTLTIELKLYSIHKSSTYTCDVRPMHERGRERVCVCPRMF